jgi:hypothetical protein
MAFVAGSPCADYGRAAMEGIPCTSESFSSGRRALSKLSASVNPLAGISRRG